MKIGFIGLGVMGVPMAENLLAEGHELRVHRVAERSRALLRSGATSAASPAEAADGADLVILMLPDTPDVEQVLFSADGVLRSIAPGALVIDMSSISPVATGEFAQRVTDAGAQFVDAPVSGGEVGARERTLTIFVGGEDDAVEQAMPVLEVLGGRVTHLGPAGAGQATKVANQIIVALTIEAVAEGLALAEASGIDPALVRQALDGGFASSKILDIHGKRMVERAFEPGFRLRLHRKDIGLAQSAAAHHHLDLPGVEAVAAQMDIAVESGWSELDHSALFRVLRGDGA